MKFIFSVFLSVFEYHLRCVIYPLRHRRNCLLAWFLHWRLDYSSFEWWSFPTLVYWGFLVKSQLSLSSFMQSTLFAQTYRRISRMFLFLLRGMTDLCSLILLVIHRSIPWPILIRRSLDSGGLHFQDFYCWKCFREIFGRHVWWLLLLFLLWEKQCLKSFNNTFAMLP